MNFGQLMGSFAIGAASSLVGMGVGQAVASQIRGVGFLCSGISSMAGGLAGGFVGGFGNSLVSGSNFGGALKAGLITGGISAITAGIIGGLEGGIFSANHDGNFWTGKGATFDCRLFTSPDNVKQPINIGDGMEYSQEYAQEFSDMYFGKNVKGVNKLYSDGTIPPGYKMDGEYVRNTKGVLTNGSAQFLGIGKGANIYLYKSTFVSMEQLYLTMGHEYLHAAYWQKYSVKGNVEHASIYKWQAYQSKLWGANELYDCYLLRYHEVIYYESRWYNYEDFGFFLLNTRPWLK
jgi:hypothetical protein